MEKNEQEPVKRSTRSAAVVGGALLAAIMLVGAYYLVMTKDQIYTDKADIEAPSVVIASPVGGTLQKILVKNGEQVKESMPVAQVADQILLTQESGEVIDTPGAVGETVSAGVPVVTIIHPEDLRVVAHVDEDKGLDSVRVGQLVSFTVDAFGSKKFTGVVDEISVASRQSGVVFNISDSREVKQFDVKIKYDVVKYPEIKNGMSAKVTIFKK